jgi:hypothetical protein
MVDHEEELRQFEEMLQQTDKPWCWACGRGLEDQPRNWWGPWLIERAHIVYHPRCKVRQAIVLLCSLCHKVSHGERIAGFPERQRRRCSWNIISGGCPAGRRRTRSKQAHE